MNETLRVDYLQQMGVVSWMPRMPLPGALPSRYTEIAPEPEPDTPAHSLVSALDSSLGAVTNEPLETAISESSARHPAPADEVDSSTTAPAPVAEAASAVPERLRLGMIQTADNGPLVICNITDQGWPDHQVFPLVNQMMYFLQSPPATVGMAFDWPFPGTDTHCTNEEFLGVLRALLSGARLQCPPGQCCWWFGDIPDLIADSELLTLQMHFPLSLTDILSQPARKVELLRYLLNWKSQHETR